MKTTHQGVSAAKPVIDAAATVKELTRISAKVLDWKKVSALESTIEYEGAGNVLLAIKEQLNKAETERKTIVDPLNGVVKHVNAKFKPYTAALQDLESHLKYLLKTYLEAQRLLLVQVAEKQAKQAERHGARQLAEDIRDRAQNALPVPTLGGVSYRDHWTYKIVDAAKVPKEYLCVDEEKVKAAIKAGERDIKGLEIYKDQIVAVSS